MPIQNNFPSIGFELLPNIPRRCLLSECLAVIQNLWRENYFEWAFVNGPKSGFFHELLVRGGLSFYGIIIIQRREGEKLGTTKSKFHEGRFSCVHSPPRRVEFEVCTA